MSDSEPGRRPTPPCPMNCRTRSGKPQKMRRLYLMSEGKKIGVAWLCPQCVAVKLDDQWIEQRDKAEDKKVSRYVMGKQGDEDEQV